MKYNLIVMKTMGKKGNAVSQYLHKTYPNSIYVSQYISTKCYRNIIVSQIPWFYKKNDIEQTMKAIHFIRPNINISFSNKATNGFSVFKENRKYKYFIPMMYSYKNDNINNKICIGYYYSAYRNTLENFLEFIKENSQIVQKILILGNLNVNIIKKINKNIIVENIEKKDCFFSSITHLVTPMSRTFVDPWPTVLEEGVRSNKQIIILPQNRNWKDGIDDICSCIKYHTKLNLNTYYDNSDSSIVNFNLNKYYNYLFNNDFEFSIDRNQFETFDKFLTGWE